MQNNNLISSLIARGFGGGDSVVVPGSSAIDDLPSAEPPAGVEYACDAFKLSVKSRSSTSENQWVLLIGGPGNGKSFQVQKVISDLGLSGLTDEDGLARRSRWNDLGHCKVLVVNDATIRTAEGRDGEGVGSLAQEFQALRESARHSPTHALISVNRGILIEEQDGLHSKPYWENEKALIDWLIDPRCTLPSKWECTEVSSYHSWLRVPATESRKAIEIYAVYLDQLSLLEQQPKVSDTIGADLPKYRTMLPGSPARDNTPAASLIKGLINYDSFEGSECGACPCNDLCPILSNVRNLRDPDSRTSLLEVLRSAEVVSGHLFTYRDLWSILAAAIAGAPDVQEGGEHRCAWINDQIELLTDVEGKSDAALNLSRIRYFESLFFDVSPNRDTANNVNTEISNALTRVRSVDPVLDAARSWTAPVLECVQSVTYDQLPLDFADEKLSELAATTQEIDRVIERTLVSELVSDDSLADEFQRRAILRWRGQTLFRMYGVKIGIGAHHDVTSTWLKLRSYVGDTYTSIPSDSRLDAALRYLLLPPASFEDRRYCLLPIFGSRVVPITGPQEVPVWCQGVEVLHQVVWKVRSKGDYIEVGLFRLTDESIATFELDFNICREALACVVYGGRRGDCRYGFTEMGSSVSARLERIRASFLSDVANDKSPLVFIAHTGLAIVRAKPDGSQDGI